MDQNNNIPPINLAGRDPFREYWEAKVLEEIKTHTYLDPLYDVAFKIFLRDEFVFPSLRNSGLTSEHPLLTVAISTLSSVQTE